MNRLITAALLLLCLIGACAAQEPTPTAKLPGGIEEGGKNQIFGGFLYMPTDWGPAWDKYYGFDVNYTRDIAHHFAAVADFDYFHNNGSNPGDIDHGIAHNSDGYGFRVGPRYNLFPQSTHHRFQPFLVGLIGYEHFTTLVPYPTRQSPVVQKYWQGFSWAVGGGMDLRLSKHTGVRGQWDTTRVPWGTETTDASQWDRISGGITLRW